MSVQDVEYDCPEEAMLGLQGRTSRIVRIGAKSSRFHLRYRSASCAGTGAESPCGLSLTSSMLKAMASGHLAGSGAVEGSALPRVSSVAGRVAG